MSLSLVTPSTEEPVTHEEIVLWLRLDEHNVTEDALIDSLLTRARQRWEEVSQRSALVQTFDYFLDDAPSDCALTLPKAPLVSVESISGFDDDGTATSMSTSGYYVDTASEFGRVQPLSAFSYPTASRSINGFRVRFTAGYSSTPTSVPESVKTEIKQLVAHLYEHRGDEAEQAKVLALYGSVPTELDLPTWG